MVNKSTEKTYVSHVNYIGKKNVYFSLLKIPHVLGEIRKQGVNWKLFLHLRVSVNVITLKQCLIAIITYM